MTILGLGSFFIHLKLELPKGIASIPLHNTSKHVTLGGASFKVSILTCGTMKILIQNNNAHNQSSVAPSECVIDITGNWTTAYMSADVPERTDVSVSLLQSLHHALTPGHTGT